MDLVVLDVRLPQELCLVLGVLVLLVLLVFQGHHVLLASQLVPLVQQPLVVQDNLRLLADLAVREYLVLPVVLPVPEDPEDREDLGGRLLAVVDAFHAVLGCSKWQVAIESPK